MQMLSHLMKISLYYGYWPQSIIESEYVTAELSIFVTYVDFLHMVKSFRGRLVNHKGLNLYLIR